MAQRTRASSHSFIPGRKAIGIALAAVGLLSAAYFAALDTSIFAVRKLVIVGGSPRVEQELRQALAPEMGKSLFRVGSSDVSGRAASLPDIVSVTFDRQFPSTLRVVVRPERGVLLLRRGSQTWLVSARGRVMRQLGSPKLSGLPRLWVPGSTTVTVGATLGPFDGGLAAAALAPLPGRSFPSGVRYLRTSSSELTLILRSGLEVRFGNLGDLRLKLAIARRILHVAGVGPSTAGYLDVSVPERPVLHVANSQLSSIG